MKLEQIAPYLPYKVKVLRPDNRTQLRVEGVRQQFVIFDDNGDTSYGDLRFVRLILRPLSDLTKPCLEDGKIPIVELVKIADRFSVYKKEKTFKNQTTQYGIYFYHENGGIASYFEYVPDEQSFHLIYGTEKRFIHYQLQLFQNLFEWHFDVFGLIESGEAIDINTLKP